MEQLISKRGFSTLEILIAMAIMVSTLTAVILVSFGNQSLLAQGSASAGALEKAQELVEAEQANARKDFRLVQAIAASITGIYQTSLSVSDVLNDPYTTKRIDTVVSWTDEAHITRRVSLLSIIQMSV